MPHHILGDMWGFCKKDLSPRGVTFRVLDTIEVTRAVAGAIEDNLGSGIRES